MLLIATKIISWVLRIAGLVLFICDVKLMKKEYDKENEIDTDWAWSIVVL